MCSLDKLIRKPLVNSRRDFLKTASIFGLGMTLGGVSLVFNSCKEENDDFILYPNIPRKQLEKDLKLQKYVFKGDKEIKSRIDKLIQAVFSTSQDKIKVMNFVAILIEDNKLKNAFDKFHIEHGYLNKSNNSISISSISINQFFKNYGYIVSSFRSRGIDYISKDLVAKILKRGIMSEDFIGKYFPDFDSMLKKYGLNFNKDIYIFDKSLSMLGNSGTGYIAIDKEDLSISILANEMTGEFFGLLLTKILLTNNEAIRTYDNKKMNFYIKEGQFFPSPLSRESIVSNTQLVDEDLINELWGDLYTMYIDPKFLKHVGAFAANRDIMFFSHNENEASADKMFAEFNATYLLKAKFFSNQLFPQLFKKFGVHDYYIKLCKDVCKYFKKKNIFIASAGQEIMGKVIPKLYEENSADDINKYLAQFGYNNWKEMNNSLLEFIK